MNSETNEESTVISPEEAAERIRNQPQKLSGWMFLDWENIEDLTHDVVLLFHEPINGLAIYLYRKENKRWLSQERRPRDRVKVIVGWLDKDEDDDCVYKELVESRRAQYITFEDNGKRYFSEFPVVFRRTPLTPKERKDLKDQYHCDYECVNVNYYEYETSRRPLPIVVDDDTSDDDTTDDNMTDD